MVKRGDYELSLIAYGGGPPVSGTCHLFVDDRGYLRFDLDAEKIGEGESWDQEVMVVNSRWPVASGFQRIMEQQGYVLRWSLPENLESRRTDRYEVLFDRDSEAKTKRRIELKNGSILIGK
jgi:hypothetical protein